MTFPVSLLPQLTGNILPPPTPEGLSDAEQFLIRGLSAKLATQSVLAMLNWSYYDGLQRLTNLGISVPPQLAGVRTVVDWPRRCVDPIVDRCQLDGFLLPGSTDVDTEFRQHWEANNLDAELPLAFLDALVVGRGYLIVGAPDRPGDSPIVTVESPLNMAMTWDPRTRAVTAAYQAYEVEGVFRAVLYLPNQTISMSREQFNSDWTVDDRDVHDFGEVPVARLVNRGRTSDREGRSEITPAVMNTTDSACRDLLGMEIAREVYAVPHLWILGAAESDFQDASGQPKSALDMAMTKVLALERDENGDLPTITQAKAFDPAVFTKMIDARARQMSNATGYPASFFGVTSTANPASADAIRVELDSLDRRGGRQQSDMSAPLKQTAQLIWRFANNGAELPKQIARLTPLWIDAATQTPAATSDAVTKQISVGSVPATSDVTLARLGYNAVQRARLEQDRQNDPVTQLLAELGTDVTGKDILAAIRLLKATGQPVPAADATQTPDGPPVPPPTPPAAV